MKKYLIPVLLFASLMTQAQKKIVVSSPDKNISITVTDGEKLQYSLSYKGKTLIQPSQLGLELQNESPLGMNVDISASISSDNRTDEWTPAVRNKHAKISLHYAEKRIKVKERDGEHRNFILTVRAYNDAVAFNYYIPGLSTIQNRSITGELTTFTLPSSAYAWVGQNESKTYTGPQESQFHKTKVTDIKEGDIDLLPMLVEIDKSDYLAITDAYLNSWPGFFIGGQTKADADNQSVTTDNSILHARLAPLPGQPADNTGVKVTFNDSKKSAWRVIMVADNPGKFIESEIIGSLNPPCKIKNTSWINPGMSAWDHWWSGEVKMEMPVIKQYIDFAATQGWPYMLIDWQWYGQYNKPEADITHCAPQLNMRELLDYAKSRNVKLWLWLYDTDVNRNDAYKKAFALYENWGIAGVKIDFMDRHDQYMTEWYRKIVECAAKHHLMVDFHGAYHPDGIDRTWPNLVTREGVMGAEYSKWSENVTPTHNINLAFTRMLAGAMDYTPGGFLNVAQGQHKSQSPALMMNTRAAELAKFIIYESPFTVFCDHPDNVLGQPGADFLQKVPTQWDDIHFISGYPGEHIAIAKQSAAGEWYIGIMNNEKARRLPLDLSFLPSGTYTLEYWQDTNSSNKDAKYIEHKTTTITLPHSFSVKMANGGGYAGILKKK